MTTIFDAEGANPPNPFSALIQQALNNPEPTRQDEVAAEMVQAVTTSRDPSDALWSLWDAFFKAVATSPTGSDSIALQLGLLDALRAHPPTEPTSITAGSDEERNLRSCTHQTDGKLFHWSSLPRFGAQWRDVHDILEAWRDWDGVRGGAGSDKADVAPNKCFLRFIDFSAALLRKTQGKCAISPIWVFHSCKEVLEREHPWPCQPRAHRMSPEEVWALDIRVTATWVREGARALWNTDSEELRRHWAAALDEQTDLWPRADGLTEERWRLWGVRLRTLSEEDEKLCEETRAVAKEAARVVEGLLRG